MQYTIEREAIATARLFGNTWSATGPQGTNTTVSGINEGETAINRAFMRFGDFSIPSYATIISATLQVYVSARSSSSGYSHNIYPVVDNGTLWTPQSRNGATWSTVTRSTIYLARDGVWVNAGLTNIAEAWKSGTADPERGICIMSETRGSWKQFDGAGRANKPRLVIVYDVPASVPVPDKSSVALGGSLTTSLIVNETGASHVIAYKIGSVTLASYNIGTATSHTYTIPTSAGANFPNALTAPLTVEVTTTVNGETRGSVTHEVTLTLPSDAAPTASCALTRTWASGVSSAAKISAYVQNRSGVNFTLTGAAKYGATIASHRVTIENKTYTRSGNGTIQHGTITGSGTITYNYTAIDSRGLSRTYSAPIQVLAWEAPKITGFTIERVTSGNVVAVDGTYARATVHASVNSLMVSGEQKNSMEYYVQYRQTGTDTWTNCDTTVSSAISVNSSFMLKKSNTLVDDFNDMQGYEFRLVISDIYASSQAADEMPTKDVRLCLHEESGSIGFGGEAVPEENAPRFDFYGPVCFRNGISISGDMYSTSEQKLGTTWVDGKPIYRYVYRNTTTLANAQGMFASLPSEPDTLVDFRVFVNSIGEGWRPLPNLSYTSLTWGCDVYLASDAIHLGFGRSWSGVNREVLIIAEYTKVSDDPTYYYLPFLTADSDRGCVASASTAVNGYPAYQAFNGILSNVWLSQGTTDSARWVQVMMPYSLKNMIVKLTDRNDVSADHRRANSAGAFSGSVNGTSWVTLATFSGRNPNFQNNFTSTHVLSNAVGYKYLRYTPSTSTYNPSEGFGTSVADMRIEGEVV